MNKEKPLLDFLASLVYLHRLYGGGGLGYNSTSRIIEKLIEETLQELGKE